MVFVWCGCWCIQCAVFPHFLRKILFSFFFFTFRLVCYFSAGKFDVTGRSEEAHSQTLVLFFYFLPADGPWCITRRWKGVQWQMSTDAPTCPPLWWPVMKVSNPHRNQKIKETTKPNNRWSKQTYTVYIPVVDLIIISDEWRSQNSNSRRPTLGQPNTHNSQIND